ncbi:AEC family transporter [Fulvimarina sp. 2208YS6-2-32]|uniref:AEC family transporter n=1 Tax=Fulvimarina uroteuthidis TaxID=3098149 RepID=A0ABU5I2X0_9HYPH|nr:AEC family transporter [Fulvimarina sp. 2208YS6-2-32]MDY8109710.1 AEC family transporter [Fulvimarina sp. 2208YS6-2-32]
MLEIFGLIAPFFGLIALGFLTGRLVNHPVSGLAWLNVFVVYLALPALFFQILSKTPVEELTRIGFIAATTAGTFLAFAGTVALGLWRTRGDLAASTIQGFAGAYGNIGYMGPGLALAAFGSGAAVPVALIFCFDNTLHFVMAPLLMALAGGKGGSVLAIVRGALWRIFSHPFIVATIFGVAAAIAGFEPPEPAERFLVLLSNAAAPCALFAMGVTLALRRLKRVPPELAWLVPIKLVVHPLLVWLLLGLVPGVDPVWVHTAMLLASLPAATNVFVIAQQYDVWVERASAAVLVSTAISVFTVAGLLYLIAHGMLPVSPLS